MGCRGGRLWARSGIFFVSVCFFCGIYGGRLWARDAKKYHKNSNILIFMKFKFCKKRYFSLYGGRLWARRVAVFGLEGVKMVKKYRLMVANVPLDPGHHSGVNLQISKLNFVDAYRTAK